MKALFWNIGSQLTIKKLMLIEEAIILKKPDIFCIAEGGHSIKGVPERSTCQTIVDRFIANGYVQYYTPAFRDDPSLKLGYAFNECGLKIFVSNSYIPRTPFTGADQRQDGRYVILRTEVKGQPATFIFLHGKAKEGGVGVTPRQYAQMAKLSDMITVGEAIDKSERLIIMGDFNLQPWDTIFDEKEYFESTFISIHNSIIQRRKKVSRKFFNPVMEYVVNSSIPNLGGTFYSIEDGWALFDTILYDTSEGAVSFDILTQLGTSQLLDLSPTINHSFLNDDLDHLPILAEIN